MQQQPQCQSLTEGAGDCTNASGDYTQQVNGDAKKTAQKRNGNGRPDYVNNGERIGLEKNSKG